MDEGELLDLLFSRYSDISYFMNTESYIGVSMIKQAIIQVRKDRLHLEYVNLLTPAIGGDNFISFDEYYSKSFGVKKHSTNVKHNKTKEEVIKDVESILQNYSI